MEHELGPLLSAPVSCLRGRPRGAGGSPNPGRCSAALSEERDRRTLAYVRERIECIQAVSREDPLALKEAVRIGGEAILWNLMALTDSTGRLSDELRRRHPEIHRMNVSLCRTGHRTPAMMILVTS